MSSFERDRIVPATSSTLSGSQWLCIWHSLTKRGQLTAVPSSAARATAMVQELRSLSRLREAEPSYLNAYDRLFRHVSLWLLDHGYQLTSQQPHQTLLQITRHWQDSAAVTLMIQARHGLKYGEKGEPTEPAVICLTQLLARFDAEDAQACQSLLQPHTPSML